MSDFSSENGNKSSEFRTVIPLAIAPHDEMRALLRRIGEGESVKQKINTAARRVGLTFTRARDLWYANVGRIDARELDAARRVVAAQEAKAREATPSDVLDRLARIEAALTAIDPEFHGRAIDALRRATRPMGPGDDEAGA
jgi:hypothetical protein